MNLNAIDPRYREFIQVIASVHSDHDAAPLGARAALDALIAQDQAKHAEALTRATRALVGMTFVLAVATIALVVAAVWG